MQITFETNEYDEQVRVTTTDAGAVIRELVNNSVPSTPHYGTRLTQLAFKKRFPALKWKAARAVATPGSDLYDFFEDWQCSTYVDLSREEQVIIPVTSLMSSGVPVEFRLTQNEVNAVLIAPVEAHEAYK